VSGEEKQIGAADTLHHSLLIHHSPKMSDAPLFIDDDDRYSRFRLIAWWDQDKLSAAKILVVGAGALGNEVLKNLALLGVGQVYVVDFDGIEESNLTRSVLFRSRDRGRNKAEAAADALHDMNPDTRVKAFDANIITDIGLGLFRDVDVVIGCLDNREARFQAQRDQGLHSGVEELDVAYRQDPSVRARHQFIGFCDGRRDRLLDQKVDAAFEELATDLDVTDRWHGQDDRFDSIGEIVEGAVRSGVKATGHRLRNGGVAIMNSHQFGARHLGKQSNVIPTHGTGADNSYAKRFDHTRALPYPPRWPRRADLMMPYSLEETNSIR